MLLFNKIKKNLIKPLFLDEIVEVAILKHVLNNKKSINKMFLAQKIERFLIVLIEKYLLKNETKFKSFLFKVGISIHTLYIFDMTILKFVTQLEMCPL